MSTQRSFSSLATRSALSALAHAIYWFIFLNLAFWVARVDLDLADQDESGALLRAGMAILAGIAVLAALMLAARRLLAAKA